MTERESLEVTEQKIKLVALAGNRCEVCGTPVGPVNAQIAHRIPKGSTNTRKYGKEIIHHRFNLAVTCSLECNGKVIVHGMPEERLVGQIKADLSQRELF